MQEATDVSRCGVATADEEEVTGLAGRLQRPESTQRWGHRGLEELFSVIDGGCVRQLSLP